jgi:hypothetical protein
LHGFKRADIREDRMILIQEVTLYLDLSNVVIDLSLQTPPVHAPPKRPGKLLLQGYQHLNLPNDHRDFGGVERSIAVLLLWDSNSGNEIRGEGGNSGRDVGLECLALSDSLKPNHQSFNAWIVDFLLGS